jgi:hypothetical protein
VANAIEIVATGTSWVGAGVGLIDTALGRLFDEAADEILITAYSVTYAEELIIPLMRRALTRGVRVCITVNKLSEQPNSLRVPRKRPVTTRCWFRQSLILVSAALTASRSKRLGSKLPPDQLT